MIDLFSIMEDVGCVYSIFKLGRNGGFLIWIYQTGFYSLEEAQARYPHAIYIKNRRVDWCDMCFREEDLL